MSRVLYVSPNQGAWHVHFENDNIGTFHKLKIDAIAAAKQIVRANPVGYISQIIIQGVDGKFQTEWTYGKDPFPPKG